MVKSLRQNLIQITYIMLARHQKNDAFLTRIFLF